MDQSRDMFWNFLISVAAGLIVALILWLLNVIF